MNEQASFNQSSGSSMTVAARRTIGTTTPMIWLLLAFYVAISSFPPIGWSLR